MIRKFLLSCLLVVFLAPLSWGQGQASRVETTSVDLDTASVDFTTSFNNASPWYLSRVSVNFSAAPEAIETAVISIVSSRFSSVFDVELIQAVTVVDETKNLTFVFNRTIPVIQGDQIRVTVTNASQSVGETNDDPTVSVMVSLDLIPGAGEPTIVFRDGVKLERTDTVGLLPTADISDVSVTQAELSQLEAIGATTLSANQWALLGGVAETLGFAELNLLDGLTVLSGSNTGDNVAPVTHILIGGSGSESIVDGTFALFSGGEKSSTEADMQAPIPMAGTGDDLSCFVATAPGDSGDAWDITLRDDGVDTNLTCQILDAATTCTGTVVTATIAANSLLSYGIVGSVTPAATSLHCSFVYTES